MIMVSLVITCALLVAGTPQESTIRIELPALVDEVTFNQGATFADDVRRFMQLSPNVSAFNGYLVPESLELCKADDARYRGCGTQTGYFSLHNAKLNLESIRKRIESLSGNDYPVELSPIVAYLKNIQQFALWRGNQELRYFQTGDLSALEAQFDAINPKIACTNELENIRGADKRTGDRIVRFDWSNCLWKAEMDKVGPYPKEAWQAFLVAHAIREKPIEESPNE